MTKKYDRLYFFYTSKLPYSCSLDHLKIKQTDAIKTLKTTLYR